MLVDSNILVYAINTSSPKHRKAQRFLQQNIGRFFVAHQNILETLRVLTHKKFPNPMRPKDAVEAMGRIIRSGRVISPDYKTHQIAVELVKKHELSGDEIFDAYLFATALVNGVGVLATDNVKDFRKFEGLELINPFS